MLLDLEDALSEMFTPPVAEIPRAVKFARLAPENLGREDFAELEREARAKFRTLSARAAETPHVTAHERQEQKNAEGRRARAAGRKEKPRDRKAYDRARYVAYRTEGVKTGRTRSDRPNVSAAPRSAACAP